MLKLIGAVIILVSGSVWGFLMSDKLKRKAQELGKIISGLMLLENEIYYGKRDIKTVLSSIGDSQKIEMFKDVSENIEKNGIKLSFSDAIKKNSLLLGTEKEALTVLSENLGMTDSDTQIKSIRHAKKLLETAKDVADEEYEKSGKLFKSAGVLGSIAVVILLL